MTATSLTVWFYDSPMGAAAGEVRLKDLQERRALRVLDAVTVTWVKGAHEPRIGHLRHRTTRLVARGSVLGALVGALVLAHAPPTTGAAAGAGVGTWVERLAGTGIDQGLLHAVREQLVPGSSALLVLSTDADLDVVKPVVERGLARGDVSLVHARLRGDAPERLRRAVADLAGPGPDADV